MTEAGSLQDIQYAEPTESMLPGNMQNTIIHEYLIGNEIQPTGSEIAAALNNDQYGIIFWHNHGGTGDNESGIVTSSGGSPITQNEISNAWDCLSA